MLPFLTIFGREFPTFYLLGILGIVAAAYIAGFRAKRYGVSREDIAAVTAFASIGLLIGAVLLFGITQIPNMWASRSLLTTDFFGFFRRYFGGLVFYGGLFGAFGAVYWYCRYMGLAFRKVISLMVPVFPLAHAIMRLGCFMGGCCFGIEFPPPLGIAFAEPLTAPSGVHLLPVQLFEAASNLVIFAILWGYTKRDRHWVTISCLYGLFYSFARFWLEFLRGDIARGFAGVFSTSQWISVVVFFGCLAGLMLFPKGSGSEDSAVVN